MFLVLMSKDVTFLLVEIQLKVILNQVYSARVYISFVYICLDSMVEWNQNGFLRNDLPKMNEGRSLFAAVAVDGSFRIVLTMTHMRQ